MLCLTIAPRLPFPQLMDILLSSHFPRQKIKNIIIMLLSSREMSREPKSVKLKKVPPSSLPTTNSGKQHFLLLSFLFFFFKSNLHVYRVGMKSFL